MNARDFAGLASRLVAGENPSPAELRTAVSRAYYAAFNVAAVFLKRLGIQLPTGWEGHRLLALALRYCEDDVLTRVSHDFDGLRGARWSADYDLEDPKIENQTVVRKWCARAKQIIKKLDECEAEHARFMQARVKVRNWVGSADGAARGFTLA